MEGVRATSLALMAVLKRKTAIGLLTEDLSKRIFEDTGVYLGDCLEALPAEKAADEAAVPST